MHTRSGAINPIRGLEHLYRRALNTLRSRLPGPFFAKHRDTQVPNLVVDFAKGVFRKFVRWCESSFESGDAFQSAIDLIVRQDVEGSLHVLNLGNAMTDHCHVVPCCDTQAYRFLKPISGKDRSHVEIVSHDETIEAELVAQ